MIRRKDNDNKKEKEKTKIYNFLGKFARYICCFDIDHDWLEEKSRKCETDFYKNFGKNILGAVRRKHIHYF